MRTITSRVASPRRSRWQAVFTNTHQTLTPIVWHHAFVSGTDMTSWSGGSNLLLAWVMGEGLTISGDNPRPFFSAGTGRWDFG
jgi:hypothetical protein